MNKSLVIALVVIAGSVLTSVYFASAYSMFGVRYGSPSSPFSSHYAGQMTYCCSTYSTTETVTSTYPDSYYWSMPMLHNTFVNRTWMEFPTRTIGISDVVLLMDNPPSYVTTIRSNNTVQFHSSNVTLLVFGMMPEDAVNLTGVNPPSYATDDVFVAYGLIDPTFVIPPGAFVHLVFVNLDDDMYHNFVFTSFSPPYSYMPMGGGMMGGGYGNSGYYYMMPFIDPANYDHETAYAYSYGFTFGGQTSLWYACTYPGHAESGMYGRALVEG